MGAALIAWIAAAMAALRASSSLADAVVLDSTAIQYEDVAGADLIMLGDDRDEQGLTATLTGEWRDAGPVAAQVGEADVAFTVVSQSGEPLGALDRLDALDTLLAAVTAALVPSAGGSNLGIDHVTGAVPAGVEISQVLTTSGVRVAVAVLTIRINLYA